MKVRGRNQHQFDAKQFAGMNPLPVFEPPAFLSGQPISNEIKIRGFDHLNLGPVVPAPKSPFRGQEITYQFTVDLHVWEFARMIAKIGYCFAVANLGLNRIAEAYVLPSILGDSHDVQRWVGSEDILFNAPKSLHHVESFVDNGTIITWVCLFAAFGGQPYTVIVGKYRT
jgi:hypothetical protein